MRPSWLWRSLCGAVFFPLVCAQKHSLAQRAVSSSTSVGQPAPTPLSISASSKWDGPDGPWSSFTIRVGTPERNLRVLISTASQQTWVILPNGCLQTDNVCPDARGGLYNYNTSSTWTRLGDALFGLSVEQNLNISANGIYGHDTISLGGESSGPTLQDQLVGGIASYSYYLGMFGVNPKATNFPGIDGEQLSYLTSLRNRNLIPSLSFAYTAGAQYRLNKVPGSLTLGGYDESRFTPNNLTFSFASDSSRDLVLGVQSIVSTSQDGAVKSLLPSGILTYVDSTVPQIWLPIEACQAFEDAFGLVYDEASELYPVNQTLHDKLIAQNPSITFVLGQLQTGGQTVNITLPYNSFDLQATPPFVQKKTKYFPLQRAKDDTQYTLGRTFLQEAYLIVDWDHRHFSLSQCLFNENSPQKIVAIAAVSNPPDGSKTGNSRSSSNGPKIGIGVGVALAVIFVAGIISFILYRRQKRPNKHREEKNAEVDIAEVSRSGYEQAELGAGNENAIHEKGDFDNDQSPGQPKTRASTRSWGRGEELSGGTSAIGELGADRVTGGLSSSEPLLGPVHELQGQPRSPAAAFELSAEQRSELPGSSPVKVKDGVAGSSPNPSSPISQPSSAAPSSFIYSHWGNRRVTRSSTRGSLRTPSSPSHPLGELSSSPETETFNSISLADDQERGRGQGGLFSFFKGKSRGSRST